MTNQFIIQATYNNAVWCDTIFRAHGWPGEFYPALWLNRHGSLPYYPNAVTLTGSSDLPIQYQQLQELGAGGLPAGWGVKDSFCALDLGSLGFRILFEATWICRAAGGRPNSLVPLHWQPIRTAAKLAAWEAAWRSASGDDPARPRLFPPMLLADPQVVFLAVYQEGRIVAGAILNRTDTVVGLSNLFCTEGEVVAWWANCVVAADTLFPGLALVGYEHGQDLANAQAVGFGELGPLRIWVQQPPVNQ